jgi:hypothetical protein
MEINTLSLNENGVFRVNDKFSVPDDMDNTQRREIQEWLDQGNTADPYVGPSDLEIWEKKMRVSDTTILPRYAEDILDGMANKLSVPQITLDRLQSKKDLRATKP